jgi:ribosomal protein S12 methylthiotransferase
LVSQDTIAYGRDLQNGANLAALVERVANVEGLKWLRIFYLYPEKLDDHLVDLIANHDTVLPYIDMPLQHAADNMLRIMRRGHGGKRLYDLVDRLRNRIEDLTLRTAFIVGHPGETDQDFVELTDFVKWARFDRVGVFRYSDEKEAHAYQLEDKPTRQQSYNRARKLMAMQRKISRANNRALLEKKLSVLVEGPSEQSELVLVGRHPGQAPEIDGSVYLSGGEARPGTIVQVTVSQTSDYDLIGEIDESVPPIFFAGAAPTEATLVSRASDGRRVLRTV